MLEVLKKPKKNGNVIVTLCITNKYYTKWKKYVYNNWKYYCDKHNIGLIVINKSVDQSKKATWQKLLIRKALINSNYKKFINNICYLDSDILINSVGAPNIFDIHDEKLISVISSFKNLPYDYLETRKRISFLRHTYYTKKYPLNSSILMKPKEEFKLNGLKKYSDYFCAGMFVFNLNRFGKFLEEIFYKYDHKFKTSTSGDEPIVNYEFQKKNKLKWLDYKFQAIWIYEMANKYPFLYNKKYSKNRELQSECITSSLMSNYFLHFAGSWHESFMISSEKNYVFDKKKFFIKSLYKYLNQKFIPKSKGLVKPNLI